MAVESRYVLSSRLFVDFGVASLFVIVYRFAFLEFGLERLLLFCEDLKKVISISHFFKLKQVIAMK
jgi:hypothetical protein